MANLPDVQTPGWPGVFKIETTTPWVGGDEGPANFQGRALKERTDYLKERANEVDEAKEGQTSLKERMLAIGSSPKALYKKQFVDAAPVAASTENIDLVTGGLLVVDKIQTAPGDLVFLKDQADPVQNGFWEAQTGAWNRYAGYASGETECFTQKLIDIHAGESNHGLIFVIETDAYVIGETPLSFVETYLSVGRKPGTALFRNRDGEVEDLVKLFHILTAHGDSREGRDLGDVLKATDLIDLGSKLHERCTEKNWSGLLVGDFVDGINLVSGSVNIPWNNSYKNTRIVLSGFNQYKGAGDTENTSDHILFTFRNCPLTRRMNSTDTNTGGWDATEMKTFLDGDFKDALSAALGNILYPLRRLNSTKGSWAWGTNTVFLPSEYEVFGAPVWAEVGYGGGFQCQFPIHQRSAEYLVKRYNGSRQWYWLCSPFSGSAASFVDVDGNGNSNNNGTASSVGGCAPAFCVR